MSLYINNGALGAMEHGNGGERPGAQRAGRGGALLLEAESPLGIGATLMLLTALVLAFLGGAALAAGSRCGTGLCWLCSATVFAGGGGWLLTLLMLFGGHDWPACWRASPSAAWGRA